MRVAPCPKTSSRIRSRCSMSAARPPSSPARPARSGRWRQRCWPAPAPMSSSAPDNADELKKVADECAKLGGKVEVVAMRPSSEANCDAIVEAAVEKIRPRRHPGGRVRPEQGVQDRRPEAGRLSRRDGRQRHAVLADGARRRPADARARAGRQGDPDVVGARAARPSRRLHRLLRVEVGGRRHHQGAGLRVGRHRHHRQCAWGRRCFARR